MFFKGSRESVLLPIVAKCPSENGGTVNIKFRARYKCLTQAERRALVEDTTNGDKNDDDVIGEMLIGWEGVKDGNDEPVDFDAEAVAAAMDFPPYREALVMGALQLIFGKDALRRKNLSAPAANG